jgi:hypothetical protein
LLAARPAATATMANIVVRASPLYSGRASVPMAAKSTESRIAKKTTAIVAPRARLRKDIRPS